MTYRAAFRSYRHAGQYPEKKLTTLVALVRRRKAMHNDMKVNEPGYNNLLFRL
jgi:hypothetical protein